MILNPVVYQDDLCDDPNLDRPVWMTQARKLKSMFYNTFVSHPYILLDKILYS